MPDHPTPVKATAPDNVVTPDVRAALVTERTEGRFDEYGWEPSMSGPIPGGCSWMSETIALRYGWRENGGCYVTPAGHIAHCWNELPDGRILDATADQFEEGDTPDGIRIVPGDDPRYDGECDCEDQIG